MIRRFLFSFGIVCCWLASYGPPAIAQTASQDEAAKRFAPILVQEQSRNPKLAKYDSPAKVDFVDFDATKNWERAKDHPLLAYGYYASVATKTHYYTLYGFFYPRDWKGGYAATKFIDFMHRVFNITDPTRILPEMEFSHENDFEGTLVVVAKYPEPHVIIAESLPHSRLKKFATADFLANHPKLKGVEELVLVGERPLIVSTSKGHAEEGSEWKRPKRFRIFTYTGVAEDPEKTDSLEVGYDLLDIKKTFWDMPESDMQAFFATRHDYSHITVPILEDGEVKIEHIEKKMVGTRIRGHVDMHNAARMPWKWEGITWKRLLHLRFRFRHNEMRHGEWFFDPAMVIGKHFKLGEKELSRVYISHPYVALPKDTQRAANEYSPE